MATVADTRINSTAEAVKVAQDAARRYMDETTAIGRTYLTAWSTASQASLRTAFEVQNAALQAWWAMLDASCQASRSWFDQTAESVHKGQEAISKLVAASFDMFESTVLKPRA